MSDFAKVFKELDDDKDHIKVYISGPVTNDKEHYDENFKKAKRVVEDKLFEGIHMFRAVSPMDYEVEYTEDEKWTKEIWLKCIIKDLELLSHCDMIILLPGWEDSAGCLTEVIAARKLGLHIMSLHEPFGVETDDPEFMDTFPTYKARDMWRKIKEIKNCESYTFQKLEVKMDSIWKRAKK